MTTLNRSCLATFGISVSYQPPTGNPFTLTMIRTAPSQLGDVMPGRYLGLWGQLSDFPAPPAKGDEVTIGTSIYTVVDILSEGDDGGGVTLTVSRLDA